MPKPKGEVLVVGATAYLGGKVVEHLFNSQNWATKKREGG